MKTNRPSTPGPCADCQKRECCNFQREHFELYLEHAHRIQFFPCAPPEVTSECQVGCMVSHSEVKVIWEDDFSREYKRMLLEKFAR